MSAWPGGLCPPCRGGGMLGYPHTPWVGTAGPGALLCPPVCALADVRFISCCPELSFLPCLPPTPNPIRNLLLGTAPACTEGSLTRWMLREGSRAHCPPQPCPAWELGVLPSPGAAPGVLGHIPSPKSSFWCSYSRHGVLQTSRGGEGSIL